VSTHLGKALRRFGRSLRARPAADAECTDGPVPPPALPAAVAPPSPPAPAPDPNDGFAEFGDFLSDLGAEPALASVEVTALDRKEREVEELRRNLELLRPIGEQLAVVERQRLAERAELQEEIDRLSGRAGGSVAAAAIPDQRVDAVMSSVAEIRAVVEAGIAEQADLRRRLQVQAQALEKTEAALERARKQLAANRAKLDERRAVATDRWNQIRQLKKRVRELERELKRAR
jgi:chromosome segregation ATPase